MLELVKDFARQASQADEFWAKRMREEKEKCERLEVQNAQLQKCMMWLKSRCAELEEGLVKDRKSIQNLLQDREALDRLVRIYVPCESTTDRLSEQAARVVLHCVDTGLVRLADIFNAYQGLGDVSALFVLFTVRLGRPISGVPMLQCDVPDVLGKPVREWTQNECAKFFMAAIVVTYRDMFYDGSVLDAIASVLGVQGAKAAVRRLQVVCAVDKAGELVKAVVLPANQIINDLNDRIRA